MGLERDLLEAAPTIVSAVNAIWKLIRGSKNPEAFAQKIVRMTTHEARTERILEEKEAKKRS